MMPMKNPNAMSPEWLSSLITRNKAATPAAPSKIFGHVKPLILSGIVPGDSALTTTTPPIASPMSTASMDQMAPGASQPLALALTSMSPKDALTLYQSRKLSINRTMAAITMIWPPSPSPLNFSMKSLLRFSIQTSSDRYDPYPAGVHRRTAAGA